MASKLLGLTELFNNAFQNKRVLVTGNTGFKGTWLVTWLKELGATVFGYANEVPTEPSAYRVLDQEQSMTQYWGDIRDIDAVLDAMRDAKPDFVFHLAAQPIVSTSYADPLGTISTNVMGTANVLEALRLINEPCVAIMITSDKCYDNVEWPWGYKETDALGGKDIYSGSKAGAEVIINSYFHSFLKSSPVVLGTTRAGNVIGGGDWAKDRIVADCYRSWSQSESVTIRSPNATRPWQHVLEPLSGYLALATWLKKSPENSGEAFNFGPKPEMKKTVKELLEDLFQTWGTTPSRPYTVQNEIPFYEAGLLKLNCDKAQFYLDWYPTLDYNETVQFTREWYERYYNATGNLNEFTGLQINRYMELAQKAGLKWSR